MKLFGITFGSVALTVLATAAFLAISSFSGWQRAVKIDAMVTTAKLEASAARDAHWTAQIEAGNAIAERERVRQLQLSSEADAKTRAQIDGLNDALKLMEADNAALPDDDRCGLGRKRVGLLAR